jgi:phenylalanyl-tRNA synthetase alpha chain
MSTALTDEIGNLRTAARTELDKAATASDLEQWRIRYLGTKGRLADLFDRMKALPAAEKKDVGRVLNELKTELNAGFAERQKSAVAAPAGPLLDWTLPPVEPAAGGPHILTRVRAEIADIFGRMGFEQVFSREVEDDFHNFTALNIPAGHPARDPRDNFYIGDDLLIRTQTSTAQIRVMETRSPPVRIIHAGRVYRPDEEDRTHTDMFHQIEALYVDEGVTMAHLKRCILLFARTYFGPDVNTRFRPSFFPFTEPSAEVDVTCVICNGTGRRGTGVCTTCKATGWIEMGGCGMVDPNVFAAVGYDAERYTGFAFGLGIERIAMRKYGVPDIRLFHGREFEMEDAEHAGRKFHQHGNDLRFLAQFG